MTKTWKLSQIKQVFDPESEVNRTVLTGSYNFSSSAEHFNNENLVVIESADVAALYEAEFQRIWEVSD